MDDKYEKMIERIYNEFVGDEYTEGQIPKVNRIDKTVKEHTILLKIIVGVFSVLAIIVAIIVDFIKIF